MKHRPRIRHLRASARPVPVRALRGDMKHRPRIRHLLTAAAAALAFVASSCADESPPPQAAAPVTETPAPAVDDTPDAPTTEEADPLDVDPCDDPEATDPGNGFFQHDGGLYELTDVGCLYRPDRPGGDTPSNLLTIQSVGACVATCSAS